MACHIYSHNEHSEGARELSRAMGIRRIKHENSTYRPGAGKSIINWGSSQMPRELLASRVLNSPYVLARVTNKLEFFRVMDTARVPEWTDNIAVAREWGRTGLVVARTVLNGHSGQGIVLCGNNGVDIPRAPLYTKYVKKKDEFRVHIIKNRDPNGEPVVFDVQGKKKRADVQDANFQIRNHDNGFVYCRNEVRVPDDVVRQAVLAFKSTGLDFGAVDVIYNAHEGQAYVLEINTAPGLSGQTVENYRDAFNTYLGL